MQIISFNKTTTNSSNSKGTSYTVKNSRGYYSNINKGEAKEYDLKQHLLGVHPYEKDNTSHLIDSDIKYNNMNISVKSNGCTVYNKVVNNNIIDTVNEFIKVDYSNTYMYIIEVDNNYNAIVMDKQMFTKFLLDNATIDKASNRLRIRKSDNKIVEWIGNN